MSGAPDSEQTVAPLRSLDKQALLARLRAQLAADLALLERRQRDAAEAATHEENRAEHAKDTRATEQSYLARGLAERVSDARSSLAALDALVPRRFARDDAIEVGALIQIFEDEPDEATSLWLLAPVAGGLWLDTPAGRVGVLTPRSPLGRAVLGLRAGDEGGFRSPRGPRRFEVVAIV